MEDIKKQLYSGLLKDSKKFKKISNDNSMYKTLVETFEEKINLKLSLIREQILKLESDVKLKFFQNDLPVEDTYFDLDNKSVSIFYLVGTYKDKKEVSKMFSDLLAFEYSSLGSFNISVKENKDKKYMLDIEISFKIKI